MATDYALILSEAQVQFLLTTTTIQREELAKALTVAVSSNRGTEIRALVALIEVADDMIATFQRSLEVGAKHAAGAQKAADLAAGAAIRARSGVC